MVANCAKNGRFAVRRSEARPKIGSGRRPLPHFSHCGRTSGVGVPNQPARQHQIGHGEQRVQLRRVLRQAAVARLAVPKEVLHDVERVLNLGADAGLDLLDPLQLLRPAVPGQRAALAGAHGHMPVDRNTDVLLALGHALVARIGEDILLVAMQQILCPGHISHIGGGADHGVHQPRLGIDADMGLHAEMPRVAFLGLVHLGVAIPLGVLGRRRRLDDGRIHHRAAPQEQPLGRQVRVDGREDGFGELLVFEQAAELEQRRGVGCRLAAQIDANEAPDRLAVVDGILDAFVRQPEAVLRDVHAQHALQSDRRATAATALRIVALDRRDQLAPRRHRFDLGQEAVASRLPLLAPVLVLGKARLHRRSSRSRTFRTIVPVHAPLGQRAMPAAPN